MRVLLLDERNADRLAGLLACDGHDVRAADAPPAAIRLIDGFDPEVIVMADGSFGELRRAAPRAGIIALVLGLDARDRIAALHAGADDCLASPWSDAELKARVRAMGRRRERFWSCAAPYEVSAQTCGQRDDL
jgi:two-component system, OmpR family, response regulator